MRRPKVRKQTHRRPPLPHWHKGEEFCRWCGKDRPSKRARWHPECVTAYKIASFSGDQRRAVWARDKGVCAKCLTDTKVGEPKWQRLSASNSGRYWQADHIRPLVEANGDLSFYTLENLQTLCTACHVEKSTQDLRRRKAPPRDNQFLLL